MVVIADTDRPGHLILSVKTTKNVGETLSMRGGKKQRLFSRFRSGELIQSCQQKGALIVSTFRKNEKAIISSSRDKSKELREEPQCSTTEEGSVSTGFQQVIVSVRNRTSNETIDKATSEATLIPSPYTTNDDMHLTDPYCSIQSPCTASVLEHTDLLYHICGGPDQVKDPILNINHKTNSVLRNVPSLQESVECMFASQLNVCLTDTECDGEKLDYSTFIRSTEILAPSVLHQSILKNRLPSRFPPHFQYRRQQSRTQELTHEQSQSTCSSAKNGKIDKIHSSSEVPYLESVSDNSSSSSIQASSSINKRLPCACCSRFSPLLEPDRWPQRPLLLRPTPGSGTRVRGIRFSKSKEYLWEAQKSSLLWPNALHKQWNQCESVEEHNNSDFMCPHCMILPINNGNELDGESLVTDFESELFEGTLLVRVRGSEGTTKTPYDDSKGYFHNVNRKYQVVVQGRFKKSLPWTECLSEVRLDRPCGKLPPKWIVKGALNVIRFFAPNIDARLDGPNPYCRTPLGSSPQTIIINDKPSFDDIEGSLCESVEASHTLLNKASKASSVMDRSRARKKAFDKLFLAKNKALVTDPEKVYTLEFLQHLISFDDDFSVDLGHMFGRVHLSHLLDGQPLQIRSCHFDSKLWSFDVWHEVLYADARRHEQGKI